MYLAFGCNFPVVGRWEPTWICGLLTGDTSSSRLLFGRV
jgi:hypothetical protein